jgi:hypothetical protein
MLHTAGSVRASHPHRRVNTTAPIEGDRSHTVPEDRTKTTISERRTIRWSTKKQER